MRVPQPFRLDPISMTQPAQPAFAAGVDPFPMRAVLLDLAIRSALLRVGRKSGDCPPYGSVEWDRGDHPLVILDKSISADMRELGERLRDTGEDARTNPLFTSLEHPFSYEVAFETRRRVTVVELSPLAVFECMSRSNILLWQGWNIEVGGSYETQDDYGCPCFEERIWVQSPVEGADLRMFGGVSKHTARRIYAHMAGSKFDGVDTLGYDLPHPCEGVPSWAVREDGSVDVDALNGGRPGGGEARGQRAAGDDENAGGGGCGYKCSAEHDDAMDAHHALAETDRAAWLARFDANGRYFDAQTGFWASLNGEFRVSETGLWVAAYDPTLRGYVATITDYSTPKGVPIELHRNRFLRVMFDGYHHYIEYLKYPSGVITVPRFSNCDFQMVKLQRSPLFGMSLEFPRGGVEHGESPSDAARREFLEETGFLTQPTQIVHLGQVGGDTATINSILDVFQIDIVDERPSASFDEGEITETVRVTEDELRAAIRNGLIKDGYTLAALMMVTARGEAAVAGTSAAIDR